MTLHHAKTLMNVKLLPTLFLQMPPAPTPLDPTHGSATRAMRKWDMAVRRSTSVPWAIVLNTPPVRKWIMAQATCVNVLPDTSDAVSAKMVALTTTNVKPKTIAPPKKKAAYAPIHPVRTLAHAKKASPWKVLSVWISTNAKL